MPKKFKIGKGKVIVGVRWYNNVPTITLQNSKIKREVGEDLLYTDGIYKGSPIYIEMHNEEGLNVLQKAIDAARSILTDEEEEFTSLLNIYLQYHLTTKEGK